MYKPYFYVLLFIIIICLHLSFCPDCYTIIFNFHFLTIQFRCFSCILIIVINDYMISCYRKYNSAIFVLICASFYNIQLALYSFENSTTLSNNVFTVMNMTIASSFSIICLYSIRPNAGVMKSLMVISLFFFWFALCECVYDDCLNGKALVTCMVIFVHLYICN